MDMEEIQKNIFSKSSEKTFIDKLLSRQDVDEVRELMHKDRLEKTDITSILNLLAGVESKMVNYSEWDRYVVLKFFTWLREHCQVAEMIFDYQDDLEKLDTDGNVLTQDSKKMLNQIQRLMQHNLRFLMDLYLNISRTTLSKGATGFMEILNNRYEISYPQMQPTAQNQAQPGR